MDSNVVTRFYKNLGKLVVHLILEVKQLLKAKKLKLKPWKKRKQINKKKKYIRRQKPSSSKKESGKCYIYNEEGHIAPQCPKKGKGTKKIIKVLEERELEALNVRFNSIIFFNASC